MAQACSGSAADLSAVANQRADAGKDAARDDAASGDAGAASVDADAGPFVSANHDPPPEARTLGGPVLDHPHIVPIFFPNDALEADVERFLTALAGSTYWTAVTSEYGVGPLTIEASLHTTDAPPTTDTDLEAWLAKVIGAAPFPPVVPQAIYAVFLPQGVTLNVPGLGYSCQNGSFGGFHNDLWTASNIEITYALLPRCAGYGSFSELDELTGALSHEVVEAATDPFARTYPAYIVVDDPHNIWNAVTFGEVGDLCAFPPQSFQRLVDNYVVQRSWSNVSAKAGHDPCVPLLSEPYYNAVPDQPDDLTLSFNGQSFPTRGVRIAVGQSRTIDVHLFSDAPTSEWLIQAQDADAAFGRSPGLSFTIDNDYGSNGAVLKLTINRNARGSLGGSGFILWSERPNSANYWVGYVGD